MQYGSGRAGSGALRWVRLGQKSLGAWFPPRGFLLVRRRHGAAIPHAFTLAAGLLFGSVVGVFIAVVGSTASAVIATLLVRATGWQLRLLPPSDQPAGRASVSEAGWPSCRCGHSHRPFAAINYAAGASGVRILLPPGRPWRACSPAPRPVNPERVRR